MKRARRGHGSFNHLYYVWKRTIR